jgi:tetratricopeptide (TPR) repeat protein
MSCFRYLFLCLFALALCHPVAAQKKKKSKEPVGSSTSENRTAADLEKEALFIEALQHRLLGNADDAITILKQLYAKDPQNHAVAYELTRLYYEKGSLTQARQYGEAAVKLNPKNEWYHIYLAETKAEMNDYVGAAASYEQLTKEFPKVYDYYYDWAYMLNRGRKYPEALSVYKELEKKIGLNDELMLQKQSLLLRLNKVSEAAADVEKMIKEYPDDFRYYGMLGELYESNKMNDKAIEAYQQLLTLSPDNATALSALANLYRKKGDLVKYKELLLRVFSNKNTDIDTKILTFIPFIEEMIADSSRGPEVLKMADMILEVHPNDPKAHAARADVLLNMDRRQEARDAYMQAVEMGDCPMTVWFQLFSVLYEDKEFTLLKNYAALGMEKNPEEPVPALYKGFACQQLKDFYCAVSAFKTGSELAFFNATLKSQFLTSLGDSYYELKNYEGSDSAYEASLEIDPNNPYTLNNYAYYLAERGEKLEKAERMSKRSLLFEDNNSSFLDTYGWIMYKLKKYDEALKYIQQALALSDNKDGPVLLDHLGDVLFRLGKVNEAVAKWQKALEHTEDDKSILEQKIRDRAIPEIK